MKSFISILLLILIQLTGSIFALATIPNYQHYKDFMLTSPGSMENGLLGYINPANTNLMHGTENMLIFSTNNSNRSSLERWGYFFGIPHLSFGIMNYKMGVLNKKIRDYRLGLGFGERDFSVGFGYGWSSGDFKDIERDKIFTFGILSRPNRYLSIGLSTIFENKNKDRFGLFDFAVRPFGTDKLTLFGDYALNKKDKLGAGICNIGTAYQINRGIYLTSKYYKDRTFTFGFFLNFGTDGIFSQTSFPKGKKLNEIVYGFRAGNKKHNIFDERYMKNKKYLTLEVKKGVNYRKYKYFSKHTYTLMDILLDLEGVINDPAVAGVALNLSGMKISPELVWEIREKLKQVQNVGKKVVIYLDRGGMTQYHLASVADKLVFDPEGMLILEGYLIGRTFLKGILEKVGLGYDEWRFFKYKSAAEVLSREQMSDPDKEQSYKLVEEMYNVVRNDVCKSRNISEDKFDELINEKVLFNANDAFNQGLVDTLERWINIKKIIDSFEKNKKRLISAKMLAHNQLPQTEWGEYPKIAIVYALGVCDMDNGINARKLEKLFTVLAKNNKIKAIVLRVDSPGGDGMASDVVANAIKRCSKNKPVIVSQGYVAASGGYWISMNADTIVAAPFTLTGSIGVIGGWIWNKNLGNQLGIVSDHVKIGDHADAFFGIRLPLLGLQIPDRNLTTLERKKVEVFINQMYNSFVGKVAQGRNMNLEDVEKIAQGRVWSGNAAKENRLIDVIGGLETAIEIAKEAAGLKDEKVTLIELPKLGLFNPTIFAPKLFGIRLENKVKSYEIRFLEMINKYPYQPMPMLSPYMYPLNNQVFN